MLSRGGVLALAAALAVGFALATVWSALRGRGAPPPVIIHTPIPTSTLLPTATASPIQVFVSGAVVAPDVYPLPQGSRIKQAIEAAGGFTAEANTALINLALPLVDGMHIYIPQMEQDSTPVLADVVTQPDIQVRGLVVEVPGDVLVNINTAGLDELDELPGIGPAIAQRIIDYRLANGPFPDISAIQEVSGIGETRFRQVRDLITTGN